MVERHQEEPYQEFETWPKSFYDDVYELFIRGDEDRGSIAFDNWEKGLLNSWRKIFRPRVMIM